ncbi:MAG: hypothetical protein ACLGH4_06315 [Actinomycetes bacterium]
MLRPSPLPSTGEVFLDARGDARSLRVSWHPEAALVVLSLWHSGTCVGTFRLPMVEVPDLIDVLRGGLQTSYEEHRSLLDRAFGEPPAS